MVSASLTAYSTKPCRFVIETSASMCRAYSADSDQRSLIRRPIYVTLLDHGSTFILFWLPIMSLDRSDLVTAHKAQRQMGKGPSAAAAGQLLWGGSAAIALQLLPSDPSRAAAAPGHQTLFLQS